jgi:hypothetical protein
MITPQGDTPMTSFRPFFNPATGEWITYTAIAEDSDGQLVRFTWRIVPGVPHSVRNPGSAEIDAIVECRPALQAKEFHEAVAGLVADGKTTPTGAPKNPLQLGATFWHFRHDSRVTSTPIWVQNLMFPPLWALAKVFGVRPYYHRWDSRIRPAGQGRPEPSATGRSTTQDPPSAP